MFNPLSCSIVFFSESVMASDSYRGGGGGGGGLLIFCYIYGCKNVKTQMKNFFFFLNFY